MAKQLVVRKSFLESYYDRMIEKSTTHKYIRRVPKSTGKGYNYFYPEDFKKPMKALLSFFGMKEDAIEKAVAIVDKPMFIIKGGRFLIRK